MRRSGPGDETSVLRAALALGRFVLDHPVGQRRRVRCLIDTARWQLTASSKPRVVPFVGDARLWARRGETGITGNIYVGLHEFAEMAFVAHLLREGDLFGDIGANAGSYSVLAAEVAGARVVAVEPVPDAAERLEANLALNRVANRVSVHRVAVTERPGPVRFTADADTVNHIAGAADSGCRLIEVEGTTLDLLFDAEPPLLLKIDVEGHEGQVLAGARRLLDSDRLVALVVEMAGQEGAARRLLEERGYAPVRYEPFARRLEPAPSRDRGGGGNAIWIRDGAMVRDRLRSAPHLRVKGLRV